MQKTCPIMEQGEQAKASTEQNQASSGASVQLSRRRELVQAVHGPDAS